MRVMKSLKNLAKKILAIGQQRQYDEARRQKATDYHDWIEMKESRLTQAEAKNAGNPSMTLVPFSLCVGGFYQKIADLREDILIFYADDGEPSKLAVPLIGEYMREHPEITLVYGDEDRWIPAEDDRHGQKRGCPWFKPDWSPDTFLSGFYFGSIFAARRADVLAVLKEMENASVPAFLRQIADGSAPPPSHESESETGKAPLRRTADGTTPPSLQQQDGNTGWLSQRNLYELCRRLAATSGGFDKMPAYRGWANAAERFPIGHVPEILYHGRKAPELWPGSFDEAIANPTEELISVIIPSKDHPDILARCLCSFVRQTKNNNYHFIVVDNGSNGENKRKTENLLATLTREGNLLFPPVYLYREMPFNFSRMCNLGAGAARPESGLLLFLNDDVEICQADWLDRMAGKALLPRAGAVGAKLLYPDSDRIQHAGVTNLRVGAAHLLQFLSDRESHYFGKNRGVHNVLAVTGACLMVRKSVFTEIGGFCEELAVALNDVDLCYSLWEAGYVNLVLNDIMLYHHESLSRGNDVVSEEKWQRFLAERDILHCRHRDSYACDPYYHQYLAKDKCMLHYLPACNVEANPDDEPWARVVPDEGRAAKYQEDAVLLIGVECAEEIYRWKYGLPPESRRKDAQSGGLSDLPTEDTGYYIDGYALVLNANNACYERRLLLKERDSGEIWQVTVETGYRPDIRDNLTGQTNVDLTGFSAKIRPDAVPPGDYQIGMMAKDRGSRQRLVNWSKRSLVIGRSPR